MSRARDKANSTVSNFASTGIDDNADANAITIDSSEIVMTGKTASDFDTAGFQTASNGQTAVTRASATPFFVNRKTDDGSIFEARKDNTAVGVVGSKGGDLTIGTGAIGVRFEDSNNAIVPFDTGTLGSSDNDIDLGKSSVRWNDLFLGGNLYIGGTGSANALSDYETGVASLSISTGSATFSNNRYTKIGNMVNVRFQISSISDQSTSAAITITGFPFATSGTGNTVGVVLGRYQEAGDGPIVANIGNSSSTMNLYGMSDGGNYTGINHFHLNNAAAVFLVNITYETT